MRKALALLLGFSTLSAGPFRSLAEYARAQESGLNEPAASVQRFEIGAQYAFLGKGVCYRDNCNIPPQVAVGPVFTWNLSPHLAIDAAANFLATREETPRLFVDGSFAGGQGVSATAGPRLEVRRKHYGLFVYGQLGAEVWTAAPPPLRPGT